MAHPHFAKFIVDARSFLYKTLPKNAVVAEIGTYKGENSVTIAKWSEPKELCLIDPDMNIFKNPPSRFIDPKAADVARQINHIKGRKFIEDYSVNASKQFDNHYFDWIYIDGDHSYEYVKADLAYWLPKVKKGGYICGHDFDPFRASWPGVNRALFEFVVKYIEKDLKLLNKYQDKRFYETNMTTPEELLTVLQKHVEYNFIRFDEHGRSLTSLENWSGFYQWYEIKHDSKPMLAPERAERLLDNDGDLTFRAVEIVSPSVNRSFKIKIGDWVDDLNFDEIIRDAQIPPSTWNNQKGLEERQYEND